MTTNIKPLGNRVLIKRAKPLTSKGGIILPDSAQEKPKEGTVISVGPGKWDEQGNREQLNVQIGDRVLFGAYAGTEVKGVDEEDLLILSEEDIMGIIAV